MSKQKNTLNSLLIVLGGGALLIALTFVIQFVLPMGKPSGNNMPVLSTVGFSEVMPLNASAVADDYGVFSDWFEIENTAERPVDLTGWFVLRGTDSTDIYSFGSQILGPGEHTVVFCSGRSQNNPSYVCHAPFGLSASGETLTLLNADGAVVETLEVPSLERNQVYALTENGWDISTLYTPGLANTEANHALLAGGSEDASLGSVELSEIMIKNRATQMDKNGEYSDYIEIHNKADRAVNLKGYTLSDDDTSLDKFIFPDVSLAADGYMLIFASGKQSTEGELHAAFSLSKGESVYLADDAGRILSTATPMTEAADQAWSNTKDGWSSFYPPTPGYSNDDSGLALVDQAVSSANRSSIYISEIMASTNDPSLSYDWIEIYNSAAGALDLSNWGLSDNSANPRKWQFPAGTTIQPGEYMIIYCSGKDIKSGKNYHTNFSLSVDGGYSVTLCEPNGRIVDRMAVSRQYTDISYGRVYGVSGLRYFTDPTPGSMNNTYGYAGRAQEATYSVQGGLFDAGESITVELSAPSGSTIYYTTDCTEPTNASTPYTAPITLNSNTILRTRVYSGSDIPSLVATQSYFFGLNHTMRVVSLVTDPDNLWDYNTGIYVMGPNAWEKSPYGSNNQGANFWMDWEKAANVEIFMQDGSTLLSQGCGLKLQGQYSRAEAQKAFKIVARSEYGSSNRFEAPLFSERDYTEYQSFILRASGQDWDKTRIRDIIQTSMASATDVMYQAHEMCVVYLNGEYWGHYNMRERINKYSIAQWEDWTSDVEDIDLIKANRTVMHGSNDTFEALLNWIKNEGGATARSKKEKLTQDDYDAILEHIASVVDVDNYLDYVAIQIYTGNTDLLNVKRYRSANEDGLWRWILFDTDWGFYYLDTNSMRRWLDPAGAGSGKKTDNTLFIELMKNPAIQDRFLRRFNELFLTVFNADAVLKHMGDLYTELEPEIDQHLARWEITRTKFDNEWASLRKIVTNRPEYMMNYIKETFNFTDAQMEEYFSESLAMIEAQKAAR